MIRYYCDWCKKETTNIHGGEFGRRVGLVSGNDRLTQMNVCFKFEFDGPSKPEHLCRHCYVRKVREAVDQLAGEVDG